MRHEGLPALALAAAPEAVSVKLARPMHLAFSYDEEIGCLGAPAMIVELARYLPTPAAMIVGERSGMKVVGGHKDLTSYEVTVHGHEAHSSLTHLGVSANMKTVAPMRELADLAARLERKGDPGPPSRPPHATLTTGEIAGRTAVTILARTCRFVFDLSCVPGQDPGAIVALFLAPCAEVDARPRQRFVEAGVTVTRRSATPAFALEADGPAERLVRRLADDIEPSRAVA